MRIITFIIMCIMTASFAGNTVVKYEDFGAKGDGKSNDFDALIEAHKYANEHNLPVVAKDNATYYLGGDAKTITIQTDTNWGNAKFIIDDTKVENHKKSVFVVTSKLKSKTIEYKNKLKANQEKIDYSAEQGAMITAENKNVIRFVRIGASQNKGKAQIDSFVVDKDGNVDPKTPIQWDFDVVTKMIVYPIDNEKLTIKGGTITTIANTGKLPKRYNSYVRNLFINRSNTIVEGVKHYIIDNGTSGFPYTGFFNIRMCSNVMLKDCVMTGRKYFYIPTGPKKKMSPMGSYDIGVGSACNITFFNCVQSNDINDTKYWGIMGANYVKNITYDKCKLSRFDAHQGVVNATIKNSEIGYFSLSVIGGGTLLIENTIINSNRFVSFRIDYGSNWQGDLIIRNCTYNLTKGDDAIIIAAYNGCSHNFGYKCALPKNITIENLTVTGEKRLFIFSDVLRNASKKNFEKNPYKAPETLTIRNLKSNSKAIISPKEEFFKDMKVVIE